MIFVRKPGTASCDDHVLSSAQRTHMSWGLQGVIDEIGQLQLFLNSTYFFLIMSSINSGSQASIIIILTDGRVDDIGPATDQV